MNTKEYEDIFNWMPVLRPAFIMTKDVPRVGGTVTYKKGTLLFAEYSDKTFVAVTGDELGNVTLPLNSVKYVGMVNINSNNVAEDIAAIIRGNEAEKKESKQRGTKIKKEHEKFDFNNIKDLTLEECIAEVREITKWKYENEEDTQDVAKTMPYVHRLHTAQVNLKKYVPNSLEFILNIRDEMKEAGEIK